jgi:spore coat polysaccharide biosynthesis protein SpsF (cytidylyltransferase family)
MAIGAIVQARMGSARLPGKVLAEVSGKPLLAYVVDRLERARTLDGVVVATSDAAGDDAVASYCRAADIEYFRGPLDDVAGRVLGAARAFGFDGFVRVSGDSPLLDQELVDRAATLLADTRCDVATNVHPRRTFPHGQSVEALTREAFERGYAAATEPGDLEHVTPVFYRRADEFAIESFEREPAIGDVRLVVDTEEDLAVFTEIVGAMTRPHWDYGLDELLELRSACVA